MRIYIEPKFRGQDNGEGGIRRVVEAQHRWLPKYDIEPVDSIDAADLVASHAGNAPDVPVGKPWVVHCHGLYWAEYEWPKWCYDLNKRVVEAMRRADHVTAPSEWVAYALRRGMWLKPTVLYHGIEPESWRGGIDGGYVLWNKTRVDPICDPEPMNQLAKMSSDVKFVSTFGAAATNVKVTGRLPWEAARELIVNAGVYLCTSRETMGIGTLEAMAAGVPVLGWEWGGQAEFVRHGETGWLVRPGDYEGLLEGLHWCQQNRDKVGKAARQDVLERFTWEHVMKSYASLYREQLAKAESQKTNPKASVVITCYKLAKYLPEAVESIKRQTMKDWEVVIVDDASPDETPIVAKRLVASDRRIRYIRNKSNLYLAGALNAGITEARGKYIVPLDADNTLAPNALKLLSEALDRDRGLHIAYGAVQFVKDDGAPDESAGYDGVSSWPGEFSFGAQMIHRNQVPSTSMYRRSVWERVGGYRRRCRTAEDAMFWCQTSSYGCVPRKVTDAVTLIYRNRHDSMSRSEADWPWEAWLPWSRSKDLVPFGAAAEVPKEFGHSWPVPSCEPPVVSVVVVVGPGHEGLVIDALDSVEAQTYRKWEAIVVNNTSKPLPFAHPWAKVIDTGGNFGPAKARNLALSVSKAPLFVPLDADDYLQPDALETMVSLWNETKGVVYSQWYDEHSPGDGKVWDPPEYDAKLLISKGCIHAVTALYPKSAWREVGGFDEALSHWEDWDFQLKLAKAGICGTKVNRPLFTYRKYTGMRREQNQAAFEEGKKAILKKWSPYWEGKEELMACRGCPGGGNKPVGPANPGGQKANPDSPGGAVLMEYINTNPGTMTFVGQKTGVRYRFGDNTGHKRKYVHSSDVPHLLSLVKLFRVVPAPALAIKESPKVEALAVPLAGKVVVAVAETPKPETVTETSVPMETEMSTEEKGNGYLSVRELKEALKSMDIETIIVTLAREKAGAKRTTAIKMLEAARVSYA